MRCNILLLLLGCAAVPVSSQAHHLVQENYFEHARIQQFAGIDSEYAGYELAGGEGNYFTLAPKVNFAIGDRLGVGIRMPFHALWPEGADSETGPGDLDLAARYQFEGDGGPWFFTAGLNSSLPTGSEEKGLGSGHTELAPFTSAMFRLDPFRLHGSLAALFSLGGHDHQDDHVHAPGQGHGQELNVVTPHADQELQYHLGLLRPFTGALYGNLVLGGFTALKDDPVFGGSTFYLTPQLGLLVAEDWRFTVGGMLPFGGHQRFTSKATLNLDFLF